MIYRNFLVKFKSTPITKLISGFRIAEITTLFLFSLLIVPNNKVLFIISSLFFVFLYLNTKSAIEALFYVLIPYSVLNAGQVYSYLVIPKEALLGTSYPDGRFIYFVLTPLFLLLCTTVLALLLYFLKSFRKAQLHSDKSLGFFLGAIFVAVFSSTRSEYLPNLSLIYSFFSFGLLSWAILVKTWLLGMPRKAQGMKLRMLLNQICQVAIFQAGIVFGQFMFRSTLGLVIETSKQVPQFGFGPDENPFQFRPIGLSYHANEMANMMLILLFAMIMLKGYLEKKGESFDRLNLYWSAFGGILFSIILSQSRAAYLVLGLLFCVWIYSDWQAVKNFFGRLFSYYVGHKMTSLVVVVVIALLIPDRLIRSFESFTPNGGVSIRSTMNREALMLFRSNWFYGVGTGMYIPAMYKSNPKGIIQFFPESVHNGLILKLVESGIFYALFIVLGYFLLLRKISKKLFDLPYQRLVYCGFLGSFTMMLFHPVSNFITLQTILLMLFM